MKLAAIYERLIFNLLSASYVTRSRVYAWRIFFVLFTFLLSCKDDNKGDVNPYAYCNNNMLSACGSGGSGNYCTFGFKWGEDNPFPNVGYDKPGPSSGQVEITYSFVDAGYVFNTHAQSNLVSLSFETTFDCSKQRIRDAFAQWESVAALKFVEQADYATANVKIILANISQGGLGFPAFVGKPCDELAGLIVFRPKSVCDLYYVSALHEVGHVLGLGHVSSDNVMNPQKYSSYDKLQPGDIEGVQSIYGPK